MFIPLLTQQIADALVRRQFQGGVLRCAADGLAMLCGRETLPGASPSFSQFGPHFSTRIMRGASSNLEPGDRLLHTQVSLDFAPGFLASRDEYHSGAD